VPTTPTKAQLRALPKKQRREVARQLAREERLAAKRRQARRAVVLRITAVVAVVAVVVAAGLGAVAWVHGRNRGPANMASDGVVLSAYNGKVFTARNGSVAQGGKPVATVSSRMLGVLDVVLYVDYSDPKAHTLWATDGGKIIQKLLAQTASLEIHPIAPGGSPSAVAAARAMACVAELAPDQAYAAHLALITGGTDWTTTSAAAAIQAGGAKVPGLASCLASPRFSGWVTEATDRAAASVPFDIGHVTGTTLILAGTAYTGAPDDAKAFDTALAAAQAVVDKASASAGLTTNGASSSPTATGSPNPSSSPTATGSPTTSSSGG
jgi:protein-disulfide isomerase